MHQKYSSLAVILTNQMCTVSEWYYGNYFLMEKCHIMNITMTKPDLWYHYTHFNKQILEGQLLPCPESCPQQVYEIMVKYWAFVLWLTCRCWSKNTDDRPTFEQIFQELSTMITQEPTQEVSVFVDDNYQN